jgi:2-amino-4-hydroxy-6-hydroxymethyldihydropteridine diphosphokinase
VSAIAYVALGSNLGSREELLREALRQLGAEPGIEVVRTSSFIETAPVGGPPGQGKYLNAAAEVRTTLDPSSLLQVLLAIERRLGRLRGEANGPRTVDLDLLLYDQVIERSAGLVLPHPRMHDRLFVLEPLAEIAPLAVHPTSGKSVTALLDSLRKSGAGTESRATPEEQPAGGRELAGLKALVTGSTRGIGAAIALELARAGAAVIIHGRHQADGQAIVDQASANGVRAELMLGDLREQAGCTRLAQQAWSAWGPLDIWVNNAGADTLTGEAGRWDFERKLSELMAVDVLATIRLSRDVGGRMKEQGRGAIINMGWDQAETGMEGESGQLFGAAKAAVMGFTRSAALALAPEVRINCLAPGWIKTCWGETASNYWQERAQRETPMGRWGTPADVAAAARWLASPGAGFITGQVIRVNGGAVR